MWISITFASTKNSRELLYSYVVWIYGGISEKIIRVCADTLITFVSICVDMGNGDVYHELGSLEDSVGMPKPI